MSSSYRTQFYVVTVAMFALGVLVQLRGKLSTSAFSAMDGLNKAKEVGKQILNEDIDGAWSCPKGKFTKSSGKGYWTKKVCRKKTGKKCVLRGMKWKPCVQ